MVIRLKDLLKEDNIGSYFEKKIMPKEGDIVYCLVSMATKIIKGKVLRITNIDNKGFGNTNADIQELNKDKIWHVAINQMYDHKPDKVEIEDEYGKVRVWK